MNPARKLYLDNIRWMTVVLVVIYHVVYMFNGVQPFGVIGPFREHQLQDCFQYLVYPWFMALLFVVSGMSARYYLQSHTTKQFLKDKARKLLVPSTIGLFVFQWLLGIYNLKIGGGLNIAGIPMPILYLITVLSGVGPLWYIQMLWLFSMLLLVVRKIEKDRVWNFCSKAPIWSILMLMIVVYGSAQVLNTPVVTVYRFGIYGFCFFAGYFLFSHEEVMERLCKWWWMFDLASAVLGISYTVRYFGENYAIAPVLNNIHACVYCWFAILGILTTMRNYADSSTAFTHWMAKKSWGLYIFHYLSIAVISYELHEHAPNTPEVLVYLLVGIGAFVGAFLLNELISRIPILRWCVLGMGKEKNVFKDNLVSLRKIHGYSQDELAEKIGVTRQTLSKYETGESLPDIERCKRLADVFGVSMDDLVNYEKTDRENLGLEVPPKGKHVFGMVKVGDKGQIVIPANARKIFDIQPGDNLLILGDEEQGIAILKEKSFLEHLRLMERMRHMESGE